MNHFRATFKEARKQVIWFSK